jgi:hypothetical protein
MPVGERVSRALLGVPDGTARATSSWFRFDQETGREVHESAIVLFGIPLARR